MDASGVKALIFDVFGTVVDWRGSIIEHGRNFGRVHGVEADWGAFADAWRGKYQPFMDRVRTGELPWTNLDGLHRLALEEVLAEFEITGIADAAKDDFNRAWHDLKPWPDSVPGLYRLKHRFIIAPNVQRQRGADDQHGQKRRPSLGLHPGGGVGPALQA